MTTTRSPRSGGLRRRGVRRVLRRIPGGSALRWPAAFLASLVTMLAANAVDPVWYAAQRGRSAPSVAGRLRTACHYVAVGRRDGHSPHPLAEPEWCDPDGWRKTGLDPVARVLAGHGRHRRIGPHPLIDLAVWTGRHPAAAGHRYGPFGHLLDHLADRTPMPVPRWWGDHPPPSYADFRAHALVALGGAFPARMPPRKSGGGSGGTLVVVESWDPGWLRACRAVRSALVEPGAVVALALAAPRRPAARRILQQLGLHPNVSISDTTAAAVISNVGDEPVAILHERAEGWPGWLARTVAPVADAMSPFVASGPLALAADGTIAEAGRIPDPTGGLPTPLLAGLPASDARRGGDRVEVLAVPSAALAGRAPHLAAAMAARDAEQGTRASAVASGSWWATDFCLRVTAATRGRCVTVTTADAWLPDGPLRDDEESRRVVHRVLGGWYAAASTTTEADLLALAGLRDLGQTALAGTADAGPARHQGVYARTDHDQDGEAPRLRWSIRIAAPAGPTATAWGDWHFAHALAAALERIGQRAAVDCHEAERRATADLDDVVVVLRGRDAPTRLPGQVVMLWVISHPELVHDDELAVVDVAFAASERWSRAASRRTGLTVSPLLQATDPTIFHPSAEPPSESDDVLFVGNTRGVYRDVVRYLVESGVPVTIYGRGWQRFVEEGLVKGESLANDRLSGHYRAARVVLNDHWDQMREWGFLSNRLFDAAASGARVVTDDIDGTEDHFDGLVRTFQSREDLLELVAHARDIFPDDATRAAIARRVAKAHSFDARAMRLLDAALEVRARRRLGVDAVPADIR